jgi:hypothetical protein
MITLGFCKLVHHNHFHRLYLPGAVMSLPETKSKILEANCDNTVLPRNQCEV